MSRKTRLAQFCRKCRHEQPAIAFHASGVCWGCYLDSFIPEGYEARERYEYDTVWGHRNATRKPSLGLDWLNHSPPRFCDLGENYL